MRWTKTHTTRSMIGVFALVGISLGGCTAQPTEAETPRPSATVGTSPSPTPTADASSDEELLPMPVEDIRDWADTAVPASTSDTGTGVLSGWLSQNTSAHHLTTFASLPSGTYQGQIACRGSGTITLAAGGIDRDPSVGPVACANTATGFEVSIDQTGMSVVLDLEGDPTVYALSLVRAD